MNFENKSIVWAGKTHLKINESCETAAWGKWITWDKNSRVKENELFMEQNYMGKKITCRKIKPGKNEKHIQYKNVKWK